MLRLFSTHYDLAIKRMTSQSSIATICLEAILVLRVILTSVEFSHGSHKVAISHLCHGITLLNSAHASSELTSLFRQLSIIPRIFGTDISKFPIIMDTSAATIMTDAMTSIPSMSEAEALLDPLFCACARLTVRNEDQTADARTGWPYEPQYQVYKQTAGNTRQALCMVGSVYLN